jgi:Periplasmic binding protein
MNSPPTTAALTLSLSGPFECQGTEAAEGVRLWAELAGIRLTLVDDLGSRTVAARAYAAWLNSIDLLIGPYASGLVRAVASLVRDAGRLLWNHGGSADDLAQPGVVPFPAPASSYFDGVVDEAVARGSTGWSSYRAPDRSPKPSVMGPRPVSPSEGPTSVTSRCRRSTPRMRQGPQPCSTGQLTGSRYPAVGAA